MINDFDALFPAIDKGHDIPSSLLSAMNSQVAPHFAYLTESDGACMLTSTSGGEFSIGGTNPRFAVVDGSREVYITGNYERASAFAGNALLPIHIQFEQWKTTLDGIEHDGQLMVRRPYTEMTNQTLIEFAPSPIETDMSVGISGCTHDCHFVQIPNRSETVRKFESKDDYPLYIAYELDSSNHKLSLRMSISPSKAASAQQYYEALRIYDAFMHGNGEINGTPLGSTTLIDAKLLHKSLLSVYRMASELENLLQVTFTPSAGITQESRHDLARLYCMLVLRRALWLPQRASSLVVSENPIDGNLPWPLTALITKAEEIELFGLTFIVYGYSKLVNAMVKSIDQLEDGTFRLHFEDSPDSPPNIAELLVGMNPADLDSDAISQADELFNNASNLMDILKEQSLI